MAVTSRAKFRTSYSAEPKPDDAERNSGEEVTEQVGYIPKNVQIRQMFLAGQRLDEVRDELFDFRVGQEVDEDYYDPTRMPNFDWSDADALLRIVEQNKRRMRNGSVSRESEEVQESEGVSESGKEESVSASQEKSVDS